MKLPDGVRTRWRCRIEPGEGNVAMAEFRVGNRDVPLPPEHSLADAATRVLRFCLPHTKIIFDDSAKTRSSLPRSERKARSKQPWQQTLGLFSVFSAALSLFAFSC